MDALSLTAVADEQLALARRSGSGRAAHSVRGGQRAALRQTVLALVAGRELAEHESPGEASLHVLCGRVRLSAGTESVELAEGGYAAIPSERHSLAALEDSVVLLTVVAGS